MREKGQLFPTAAFQWINVEGMMEMEKHHWANTNQFLFLTKAIDVKVGE